jgi:ABC-type sugar transport system ATPase subunit
MSLIITEEVSIAELDEAISNLNDQLKTDTYGNRMDWRKRQLLQSSIDDLLDARLEAMSGDNQQRLFSSNEGNAI